MRRLLREAALGELGNDLSTTADETLINTGLDAGDSEITVTWRSTSPPRTRAAESAAEGAGRDRSSRAPSGRNLRRTPMPASAEPIEEDHMEQETRIMEPIPAPDEIRITATPWLEEVSEGSSGDSLEWPAADVERDLQHRERIDTPRVRHLFPVPEDADWEVSHLEFEYSRRSS